MNKRGQFFILAAVIFSGLLLSVSLSVNQITATRQNSNFYKSSEMVDREISYVQNYQVYHSIGDGELSDFVANLSANLLDNDPDLNFVLVYGNASLLKIRNFGSGSIIIGDDMTLDGENELSESKILISGSFVDVDQPNPKIEERLITSYGENEINIQFGEYSYPFNITEENQVIYILQKETEVANYVEVK